jgi:hypothetical protein
MLEIFQFLRADCMKDPGVVLDSKLHYHCHVDFVHSQASTALGLVRYRLLHTISLLYTV